MMKAMKTLFKAANSPGTLAENQVLIDGSNTKCHESFSMYPEKTSNQLEQDYYNKDRGCSVRAQENNLFDYKSWSK